MKSIKFFLYIFLSVFLIWSLLIITGPKLIRKGVDFYFEKQVEIGEVSISPKLHLQIKNINFDFKNSEQEIALVGTTGSMSIYFSILGWVRS